MSNLITKLLTGFLILVVIVSLVAGLRADILSGGAAYDIFISALESFPFAKLTAEIANTIGKFPNTMNVLSPSNIISDLTKLLAMTVVCPMLISIATSIFLPVPAYEDWYDREKYMQSLGYKIKSALMNVIMMPVCAMVTTVLVHHLLIWLQGQLPFLHETVISLCLLAIVFVASVLIQSIERPTAVKGIVQYRVVDLLGNVLKTVGMNLLCFLIAFAFLNDRNNAMMGYIVLLFIYLVALDLMIGAVTSMFI